MKTGLAQGLLLSIAVFSFSGCKTQLYCEPLGTCGGDFLQGAKDLDGDGLVDREWTVDGPGDGFDNGAVCEDQLQTPPASLSLLRQPPVQSNQRPPDPVTADWCYNLRLNSTGDVSLFELWQPPLPLQFARFVISEDYDHSHNRGRYSVQTTTKQTQTIHLSESCLTAQGLHLKCAEFGRRLGQFLITEANLYFPRCYDPDDPTEGGCDCQWELTFLGGPNGRWYSDPGSSQITFFDDTFAPPAKADYCYNGDKASIDLTGDDVTVLFNQKSLRTMHMTAPSCTDGILSPTLGETGIDCGGQCPPCGSCTNNVHDSNEEGIDCGGACLGVLCDPDPSITDPTKRLPSCADGKQEKWEEGVDCGGPCTDSTGAPKLCP
jgi:hypothetical protein